jgi:hypothetical protein
MDALPEDKARELQQVEVDLDAHALDAHATEAA